MIINRITYNYTRSLFFIIYENEIICLVDRPEIESIKKNSHDHKLTFEINTIVDDYLCHANVQYVQCYRQSIQNQLCRSCFSKLKSKKFKFLNSKSDGLTL